MLTIEEALELIARNVAPLAPRSVPLGKATGLVLAEDVVSDVDSPPYTKSLMDGYAVISGDCAPVRHVLEEVAAGAVPQQTVTLGSATRIMTGAPLPVGADSVIPIEKTELLDPGDRVRLNELKLSPGQNVLPRGAVVRTGQAVLTAGAIVRPVEIAILAEFGQSEIQVYGQPRVAVLPTGNEIVPVTEKPAIGQIRNSNGPMLIAAAAQAGGEVIDCGIGRDDRADLRRRIEHGLTADILLLSGGVSAGKFDLVPDVLSELGVEQVFHKVSLRPGKPLWFGVKHDGGRRTVVFGLPGNPVSSFVCFELFVRPAIAALAGRGFVHSAAVTARIDHRFDHAGGRAACLPAHVSIAGDVPQRLSDTPEAFTDVARMSCPVVEILPWQGSADIAALSHANCLARLPAEKRTLEKGDPIEVLLI
jgi:molybdopterin molybdotransferase